MPAGQPQKIFFFLNSIFCVSLLCWKGNELPLSLSLSLTPLYFDDKGVNERTGTLYYYFYYTLLMLSHLLPFCETNDGKC